MKFPETYLKHKKVLVDWSYAWGKVGEKTYFHCANFTVNKDGKVQTSTHISIHDPEPHYYENVNDGYAAIRRLGLYFVDDIRLYIKEGKKHFTHKISDRKHSFSPDADVKMLNGIDRTIGVGWAGYEKSDKHWAGIIYEKKRTPIVNNWNWVAIKMDDGRDIMVYDTKKEKYCCVIDGNKVKRIRHYWLSNNYLHIPRYNLKITLVPIALEKVFEPEVGMAYSVQPFSVISNAGGGYGIRECTCGGVEIMDKMLLYGE